MKQGTHPRVHRGSDRPHRGGIAQHSLSRAFGDRGEEAAPPRPSRFKVVGRLGSRCPGQVMTGVGSAPRSPRALRLRTGLCWRSLLRPPPTSWGVDAGDPFAQAHQCGSPPPRGEPAWGCPCLPDSGLTARKGWQQVRGWGIPRSAASVYALPRNVPQDRRFSPAVVAAPPAQARNQQPPPALPSVPGAGPAQAQDTPGGRRSRGGAGERGQ